MAGPATCLFRNLVGQCAGESSEHVIPKCLGGTLESREVLCDICNHFFGDSIDQEIASHFEPIVTQFGLAMRAQYRRRAIPVTSLTDAVPLVRRAGGVVELRTAHEQRDAAGTFTGAAAPLAQAHRLPGIAAREAPGTQFTISTVPLTDILDEPLTGARRAFTDGLRRAVAKILLEVVDERARADRDTRFRRAASLDSIRRFIRIGGGPRIEPAAPMIDLGAEMSAAFRRHLGPQDDWMAALCTDVAIICDAQVGRLFGLITVARTMPLIICLAESVEWQVESWSLLVRRPLVPGPGSHVWLDTAVIDWRAVRWAEFAASTNEAIRFARTKYNEAYSEAMGRAVVHIDRTDDVAITATLAEFRNARNSSGAAVVEALRLRFIDNDISELQWRAIHERVENENVGVDDALLRRLYRRELEELVNSVGLPLGVVQRA